MAFVFGFETTAVGLLYVWGGVVGGVDGEMGGGCWGEEGYGWDGCEGA